jgi:hypothetical protein
MNVRTLFVGCGLCKREIVLQQLPPDFCLRLGLPERFGALCQQCEMEFAYDIYGVYAEHRGVIANLTPHPEFQRLPR